MEERPVDRLTKRQRTLLTNARDAIRKAPGSYDQRSYGGEKRDLRNAGMRGRADRGPRPGAPGAADRRDPQDPQARTGLGTRSAARKSGRGDRDDGRSTWEPHQGSSAARGQPSGCRRRAKVRPSVPDACSCQERTTPVKVLEGILDGQARRAGAEDQQSERQRAEGEDLATEWQRQPRRRAETDRQGDEKIRHGPEVQETTHSSS